MCRSKTCERVKVIQTIYTKQYERHPIEPKAPLFFSLHTVKSVFKSRKLLKSLLNAGGCLRKVSVRTKVNHSV